jgi:hypothetical protein
MKLRLRLVGSSQYISGSGLQSIEPKHRQLNTFRLINLSSERTMLVAERFIIASLINKFGKCPVSTDGRRTWYPPQTCQSVFGRRTSSSYPFLI